MSVMITGEKLPCYQDERYNKYQTKQYTRTLCTQQMMASNRLGDHQGRPSVPAIHRFTWIDTWHVTSQVLMIMIIVRARV